MKRNLRKLITCTTILFATTANTLNAQEQEDKPFIFDAEAYYGFPNLFSDLALSKYESDYGFSDYSLTDFGPAGLRVEFFINKNVAFGADAGYSTTQLQWEKTVTLTPQNTIPYERTYHYRIDANRLRILAMFNAHFGLTKHFDWHAGAGFGYNETEIVMTSDDPKVSYDQRSRFPLLSFPICFRAKIGGRYYFLKNLGVGFETGIGGPLFSLGLCARL